MITIAAIPDGLATASLFEVRRNYGLYNRMVGTLIEAVFTSSTYMALMSFRALAQYPGEEQIKAIVT